MSGLIETLEGGGQLLGDGAMGTMLQEAGLTDGGAPELWNVEQADKIEGILEAYAAAGSNLITTCTFGGTRPRLEMHDLGDRVEELNRAGAQVARRVADRHPGTYLLGDVGPSGELMEPLGTLTVESGQELFAEQIRGLVAGGVDAILIETMSDLGEVEAAVNAAKAEAPGLPILVTMSFDTNLRTMMGVKPGQAVEAVAAMGVQIVGANCGRGPDEMRTIAAEMAEARPAGVYLMTQSNAGLPQLVGDEFQYDGTPQVMADWATDMRALGIDVIGACCGSTPDHIAAMRPIVLG